MTSTQESIVISLRSPSLGKEKYFTSPVHLIVGLVNLVDLRLEDLSNGQKYDFVHKQLLFPIQIGLTND